MVTHDCPTAQYLGAEYLEARILDWYVRATPEAIADGLAWYADAQTRILRLAARYGYGEREAIAAFAALSPRMRARNNVWMLLRCMVAHRAGLAPSQVSRSMKGRTYGGCFEGGIERAFKALDGDVRRSILGQKVRSFYLNLRGRDSEVTVDRHALTGGGVSLQYHPTHPRWREDRTKEENTRGLGTVEYRTIRAAYQAVAARVGVSAMEMQAAVWVAVRGGESW